MILRIAIMAFLFLVFDLYTYQGVKTVTSNIESGLIRKFIIWFYWLFSATVIVLLFFSMYKMETDRASAMSLVSIALALFFLSFFPKLIYSTLLLVEDVGRMFYASYDSTIGSGESFKIPARRKFISQLGFGIATVMFGSVLYGLTKGKYNYKVKEVSLDFPDLPKAFDGYRILQISDIHSGSFDSKAQVGYGVDLINNQNADVIVFTGDMVNSSAEEIVPYKDIFKKLNAPDGMYSVMGNHDYSHYRRFESKDHARQNVLDLKQHQNDMGFAMLDNDHRIIERAGEQISIVGVENWGHSRHFPKKGDIDKAIAGLAEGTFKVLLSHDPSHWDNKVLEHPVHFPLTLSGHTHGGQFGIQIPGFQWSPIKYRYPRWSGLYTEKQQNLYVNQGFGYLAFPGRVGMPPEITVFTLNSTA